MESLTVWFAGEFKCLEQDKVSGLPGWMMPGNLTPGMWREEV